MFILILTFQEQKVEMSARLDRKTLRRNSGLNEQVDRLAIRTIEQVERTATAGARARDAMRMWSGLVGTSLRARACVIGVLAFPHHPLAYLNNTFRFTLWESFLAWIRRWKSATWTNWKLAKINHDCICKRNYKLSFLHRFCWGNICGEKTRLRITLNDFSLQ